VRRVLIVTAREYRRMTHLPAFWIISLIVPLFVLAVPVEQTLFGKSQTVGYVLVDKSGRYAPEINRRIELDYQRQVLVQLLGYAQDWRASSAAVPDVAAAREVGSSSSSDAVVQNFVAGGGAPAVLRLLQPRLLPGAPAFQTPPRPFVEIPLREGVATDSADRFGTLIGPDFREMSKTSAGTAGLGVAIFIPDDVDSGGQARVWTNGPAGAALVQDLRSELTQGLRLKALRAAAVDPLSVAQIESISAPISISAPEAPTPGGEAIIHSTLPLALAGLLLLSTMITGAMMLQGLVEERSNKLLEAVLACVSPRELMVGKLLGISLLGLSIIGIWVGATIGIARAEPSSSLGVLVPALAALGQTPWICVAMIFYFLAGYLTLGMIFLAVGVLSDSMQEAQAYLTPLMLVIVGPAAGLGSVIFRDPNGLLPRIISWIPLYTAITMLARLQSGVSIFEIVGTAAALLSFGALEWLVLGHLFEHHLISTGGGLHLTSQMRRRVLRGTVPVVVVAVVAVAVAIRHSRAPAPGTDQSALRVHGESVFKTACASCHDPAVGGTLSREQMVSLTPQEVVETLTSGGMKTMAARLSDADIQSVATYLTNRQPGPAPAAMADPPSCARPVIFGMTGGDWNGWSIDPRNWRLQPDPGITAADIPRLKVKWALSYVGGKYGQPTLVGGRVFLTSRGGALYSLDAKTGCMYWRFAESVSSRTTVSVGPLPNIAPSGYAAYFGDFSTNVYAVDAASGALLWRTPVDPHPRAMLTGSPVLFRGRLYVPVSSNEEGVASSAEYACCSFRGSVVALDAGTGKVVWKAFGIDRAPAPTNTNSAGTQMYGPAGAGVWSAPTIDTKRNRLYFATGDSYTDVEEGGADAVIAVDLASGRTVWRRQVTQNDNFLAGCAPGRKLVNCPATLGHDYDFGASPILMTLQNGKDLVLAGQKSGEVFGIDPNTGEILWRTQVGVGGFLGGVEWGMASDGTRLYVANADIAAQSGRPGLFALDPATGKDLWYAPAPRVGCGWASGAPCFNAQSAAPSAIPGVVFSGTTDGHERAYLSADGRMLWDFDTARDTYRTLNGVGDQAGGAVDVTSGVLADGMLYVISGYRGPLGGGSQNVVLAFSIDGR
jgi:polyvinyl alcohol dehydrogenase (cytochrome)